MRINSKHLFLAFIALLITVGLYVYLTLIPISAAEKKEAFEVWALGTLVLAFWGFSTD
jgi:hypothetical protein